jgi:hypothetical protein
MKTLPALFAAAALAACSAPQPSTAQPTAGRIAMARMYVAGFYAKEPDWGTDEAVRGLFDMPLAEAIIKDRKAHPDEVGAIDFAFTCGCQDGTVTDLTTEEVQKPHGAQVTARFKLEGQPVEIIYDLGLTDRGWRIRDVSAPAQRGDQPWSLRQLLGLRPLV